MKRIFALVLALSLALLCLAPAMAEETEKTGVTMRVASLKGPTTMGLVKLMQDAEAGLTANDYTFAMEGTADAISPLLIQGELDAAMIPCNLAAVLINRTEGALEIAMGEYDGMIAGSRCLVTGFGRIGKVLSGMLKGMGARVTVSARKPEDLAWIEIYGYTPVSTGKLSEHQGFDFIFNTVPTLIFDAYTLAKTAQGAILIDLASLPGGAECRDAQEKARPGEVGLAFSFH